MSSLAAARADNFYYAPEFNPDVHKSLNKVSIASYCSCGPSALCRSHFLYLWPCDVQLCACAVPAPHRLPRSVCHATPHATACHWQGQSPISDLICAGAALPQ